MQKPAVSSLASSGFTRRDFLRTTALAIGATAATGPFLVSGQNLNSKIRLASVGVGGKGKSDTNHCASDSAVEVVALCDADRSHDEGQLKTYPNAKFYTDYRKMFEEMAKDIDAVTVSTPDHNHAIAASIAMAGGKHVYCQKPLTQTVYEARYLRDLAKKKNVVTQMGNQGSAEDGLRRAVECIQAGLIGPVREIHVWSNRPIWPQGIDRPEGSDPVPEGLDWEAWIGPAAMRPYKRDVYNPFKWRGWLDFGTGALGDMACHTANMPFRAAKLGYPSVVEAEDFLGMTTETYPKSSKIRFEFPDRDGLPATKFWWYDGDPKNPASFRPKPEVTKAISAMDEFGGVLPGSGCLLIGDKGQIFSPDDYGARFFLKLKDDEKFRAARRRVEGKEVELEAVAAIPQTIPRNRFSGDADRRQHLEWIAAIKENKPDLCYSRFDIAAYLTEIILLGCIALRVGKGQRLDWDGPAMTAKNAPTAAQFVKRQNRPGWVLAS